MLKHKKVRRRTPNGCRDWDYKWHCLMVLGGISLAPGKATQVENLVEQWASPEIKNLPNIASKIVGVVAKYSHTRPEHGTGMAFLTIAERIFRKHNVNGQVAHLIKDATAAELHDAIPEYARKDLLPPPRHSQQDQIYPIQSLAHQDLPNVSKGILAGRINQMLHYISSDGPDCWDEIRNDPSYGQSKECMESIRDLLKSTHWLDFLNGQKTLNLLMLGGGAPEKEAAIIQSAIAEHPRIRVKYHLFDASAPMITHTNRKLADELRRLGLFGQVTLAGVFGDFTTLLGLPPESLHVREARERLAWFCPGGTIGNLYEDAVFKSVAHHSQPGDVFVVGAEHVDSDALSAEQIQSKYLGPRISAFVTAPIRSASTRAPYIPRTKERLDKAISIELLSPELSSKYSSVEGARTISISIRHSLGQLVLHTSTRYPTGGIETLAAKYGFAIKETFLSSTNPRYKTFFFEYKPS